jgi:hypothetical protein
MLTGNEAVLRFRQALERVGATSVEHLEVRLGDLRYAGQNRFKIGCDTYEFAPAAWSAVNGYLALPPDLLPQLSQGLGGLVVKALHGAGRRAPGAPEHVLLACNESGTIVAASRADILHLDNSQVVAAVRAAWPNNISPETLYVSMSLTETEFELTCHTDALSVEPRPGDILNGGISIRHSQVGSYPTVVLSYVHRLVCSNGLTQRVCFDGTPSRTKRGHQDSPDRTLDAIGRQVRQAWTQLDERMSGMKELLKHRLDGEGLPEGLRRRWSINRGVAEEIAAAMQHDELGRTQTEYDLMNALSRVATHSHRLEPRYRRQLSLAAGIFAQHHVHRCEQCGTWLFDAPGATN